VAEGLVERIGEEIDKRIDARLGGRPAPGKQAPSVPPRRSTPAAYQPPAAPTPDMPASVAPPARRNSGLSGMVLGLGSMGLGVGATAVVVAHHVEGVASVLMVLLIWAAIAVINIAHSQRN
jgi:predicted lipid-binding transport protein (Tim44 family)